MASFLLRKSSKRSRTILSSNFDRQFSAISIYRLALVGKSNYSGANNDSSLFTLQWEECKFGIPSRVTVTLRPIRILLD